jgi:protein-disulfide isomerase
VKKAYIVLFVLIFLASGIASAQKMSQSTKGKAKMKIEILYFDSCPSYKDAIANVKAVLKEKNIQAELKLIKVEDEEKAEKVGFQGSPSVRINGKDVEGRDEGFTFGCRLYRVNGKPATAPSKEAIIAKIDSLVK